MKLVTFSDVFIEGVPHEAGVPFDRDSKSANELIFLRVAREATEDEIAKHEGMDAETAANDDADARNEAAAAEISERRGDSKIAALEAKIDMLSKQVAAAK